MLQTPHPLTSLICDPLRTRDHECVSPESRTPRLVQPSLQPARAPGPPPAGGSPRASSPPLDRATSAPVFEDDAELGSGGDDEAHSGFANGSAAGGTLRNRFASPSRSMFEDGGGDFTGAPSPMRMDLASDAGSDLEVKQYMPPQCCDVVIARSRCSPA